MGNGMVWYGWLWFAMGWDEVGDGFGCQELGLIR